MRAVLRGHGAEEPRAASEIHVHCALRKQKPATKAGRRGTHINLRVAVVRDRRGVGERIERLFLARNAAFPSRGKARKRKQRDHRNDGDEHKDG